MSLKKLSPTVRNGLIFGLLGLLAIGIYYLSDVVTPFLISLVIAYILNPLVRGLEQIKIPAFWRFLQRCRVPKDWLNTNDSGCVPRSWAVLAVFVVCFVAFILFIVPFTISIASDGMDLALRLKHIDFRKMLSIERRYVDALGGMSDGLVLASPSLASASAAIVPTNTEVEQQTQEYTQEQFDRERISIFDINAVLDEYPELKPYIERLDTYIPRERLLGSLTDGLSFLKDGAASMFNKLLGFITDALARMVNMFLVPILVFYILLDMDQIAAGFKKLLPPDYRDGVLKVAAKIDVQLNALLRGMVMANSIFALLMVIGLSLSGIKFWLFLGLFAGLANFIPYLGGLIISVLALIIALTQFGIGSAFVWVMIKIGAVILVIQIIDGWYLQPYVIGGGVGLSPLTIMLALAVFGGIGGIAGLVLAVPATVIIKVVGSELYEQLYYRSEA